VIPNVEFEKQPDGTYTAKVPEGIDGEITVKVPENSYQDDQGNAGEPVVEQGPVDTESPVVDVQIGEDGTITLTYPDDTVPESIDTSGIVITDPEGNVIPNVEFEKQPDGTYTAKVPEGIDGEITVKVPENSYQDDQGNAGEPVVEQGSVDTEAPTPTITIEPNGTITVQYGDDADKDTIDPQDIVVKDKDGNDIVVQFTPSEDGKTYTGKVPTAIDEEITVTVPEGSYQDTTGNDNRTSEDKAPIDTIAPQVEVQITEDGTITITYDDDVVPETIKVPSIVVQGPDNTPLVVEFVPSEDGLTLVGKVPEDVTGQVTVTVPAGSYEDEVGNKGNKGKDDQIVDTEAPVVTVDVTPNGTITLTYPDDTDPDSIDTSGIVVTDPEGNIIPNVEFSKQPDGSYTAKVPEGIDGDIIVKVPAESYEDQTGNPGQAVDQPAIVDTIPPKAQVEITEDGQIIVTYPEGTDPDSIDPKDIIVDGPNGPITVPFEQPEKQEDGSYVVTGQVPPNVDGEVTVTVPAESYEDEAGNPGLETSSTDDVDTLPPTVTVTITPDGVITLTYPDDVKPEDIDLSVITVTDADNDPIVVEFTPNGEGSYTAKVPNGNDGNVTVHVPENSYQDETGNPGQPVEETQPVDTIAPEATISIDPQGNITITYDDDVVPSTILEDRIKVTDTVTGETIVVEFTPSEENPLVLVGKVPEGTDTNITVTVPAGSYEDEVGNKGTLEKDTADVDAEPPKAQVTITPDGQIIVTYPDDIDPDKIVTDRIIVTVPDPKDPSKQVEIEVEFGTPVEQEDGSYVVTGQVPPNVDADITVTVPTDSYTDKVGNPGEDVTTPATNVDTLPPKAEVTITPDGQIIVTYPDDIDPDSIDTDKIVVEGPNGPITVPFDEAVKQPDGSYVVTGQVPPNVDADITVTVPTDSYADDVGNPGEDVTTPATNVDTLPPKAEVTITPDGQIIVKYPDDVTDSSKNPEDIIVKNPSGQVIPNLEFEEQPDGSYIAKVPQGIDGNITVLVPGEYVDDAGNPSEDVTVTGKVDTVPPKTQADRASVIEAGANEPGIPVAKGNVLANDEAGTSVTGFAFNGTTVEASQSITTKYGKLTIGQDGQYTYELDNTNPDTQALQKDQKVSETITYTIVDERGYESTSTLTIDITGKNDASVIEQKEATIIPVIVGKNTDGSFENGTVPNGSSGITHSFSFNIDNSQDTKTTQVVVNLEKLDNSFSIKVNGVDIHDNKVFQVQNNDYETPVQVPLKFADGSWLSAGNPWNANENGLPRFQIIMNEDGIRFFATRNTKSTQLEEIFYDSIYANGINLPDFNVGNNQIDITNVNGIDVDAIKGYMTVTTRGKFSLEDVDSEKLTSVKIAVKNYVSGDEFIPVLPKGITATQAKVGSDWVITLSGNASKEDYEDALNSLMYRGKSTGNKSMTITLQDDQGASTVLSGELNYSTANKLVTLTQVDFTQKVAARSSLMMLDVEDDAIYSVLNKDFDLNQNTDVKVDNFTVGSQDTIDISALLSDDATDANLSEFVTVDYNAESKEAVISIDRDGEAPTYQSQPLVTLLNQPTAFDLEQLLNNNQIIY
ncbi:type I secretion C-terminal target domain-containing protein, partial [Acinetobacter sp. dk771]